MPPRAAIYCRISDDREGAGLGVARQEKDCRALARSLSAQVVEVYVDNDISAFQRRKPRPAYLKLLTDIQAGQVDVVLVWHTDRLHRSNRELEDWIDAAEPHGVNVHAVKGGLVDLSTPVGRMTARVLGAAAQHESEQKRERNLRKALELAEAGKIGNGGPRPFGYQDDRRTLHPTEARLLRQAYADVLTGKGLRTICREWRTQDVTTTLGNPWTAQALRFTLLRARNIGWRSHHGRLTSPGLCEPLIDRETWEQVRAILTSTARPNAGRPAYARRYLLTGYLHCGLCGSRLTPSRNADLQRFACRPEPGNPKCGKILVRYQPLEQMIVDLLLARIEHDVDLQPDPDDPTDQLREQIADREERLRTLAAAYADRGDFVEMRAVADHLRGEITDLRRQITTATRRVLHDPVSVRENWPGYDLDQRRAVLDVLVERIVVGPARPGNRFQPERVSVEWR